MNIPAAHRDSCGSQIPLCSLLFPSPLSCTDVGCHAGLIVVGVVFLCLPSFVVDILFMGLFLLSWSLCLFLWRYLGRFKNYAASTMVFPECSWLLHKVKFIQFKQLSFLKIYSAKMFFIL